MKKVLVTILSLIYLVTSTGATIHMHYCMGRLVEWGLQYDSKKKDKCSNCGMKNSVSKKGCCKDEQRHIQIEKDQKAAAFQYNFNKLSNVLTFYSIIEYTPVYHISPVLEYTTAHAPPFNERVPLFVRNCVFRI